MPAKLGKDEIKRRIEVVGFRVVSIEGTTHGKCCVRCVECGNEFITTPQKLISKHTKSCGCVAKGKRKGTDIVSGDYFRIMKEGAKRRKLQFDITIEYISNLLKSQKFKCKLSGLDITTSYNRKVKEQTASLDRIDNSKGYIEGNVQWVHRDVNWMKQDFQEEYFFDLCKRIIENARFG
jgi:hypothetical protein